MSIGCESACLGGGFRAEAAVRTRRHKNESCNRAETPRIPRLGGVSSTAVDQLHVQGGGGGGERFFVERPASQVKRRRSPGCAARCEPERLVKLDRIQMVLAGGGQRAAMEVAKVRDRGLPGVG